ncbi:unnamed protein product [Rangifer tarandus platyrhynchus]|uniref:Uncharacterized protein n=1 Tax=Rangifer tarandus platyrhynchus TaxID=3082113 RepID=A0ABN8YE41_RANTA|nr:unnamed protein product [Rangifer tarandus platyrhynchus]
MGGPEGSHGPGPPGGWAPARACGSPGCLGHSCVGVRGARGAAVLSQARRPPAQLTFPPTAAQTAPGPSQPCPTGPAEPGIAASGTFLWEAGRCRRSGEDGEERTHSVRLVAGAREQGWNRPRPGALVLPPPGSAASGPRVTHRLSPVPPSSPTPTVGAGGGCGTLLIPAFCESSQEEPQPRPAPGGQCDQRQQLGRSV